MLRLGQVVDEAAGQHVDELDVGIPDDEAARRPDSHGHLQRELDRRPARRPDRPDAGHRLLHRDGGCGRPRPVVAIDPAGDRVAREVDDLAAASIELLDDRMEDAADVRRQLLCAALCAELVGQRLGQWREARDIGEQRGAMDPVGQDAALEERPSPVTRQVGVGDVDEATDGRCLGRDQRPSGPRRIGGRSGSGSFRGRAHALILRAPRRRRRGDDSVAVAAQTNPVFARPFRSSIARVSSGVAMSRLSSSRIRRIRATCSAFERARRPFPR